VCRLRYRVKGERKRKTRDVYKRVVATVARLLPLATGIHTTQSTSLGDVSRGGFDHFRTSGQGLGSEHFWPEHF
jgi:hypothetical protein